MVMAVNWPSLNALKAQGHFGLVTGYLAFSCLIFLPAVYLGARINAGVGASVGVAVYSCLCGPIPVHLAVTRFGGTWRDTCGLFVGPISAGLAAFAIASLLALRIPPSPLQNVLRIVVVTTVGCGIYVLLIRVVALHALEEIKTRIQGLMPRNTSGPLLPE